MTQLGPTVTQSCLSVRTRKAKNEVGSNETQIALTRLTSSQAWTVTWGTLLGLHAVRAQDTRGQWALTIAMNRSCVDPPPD